MFWAQFVFGTPVTLSGGTTNWTAVGNLTNGVLPHTTNYAEGIILTNGTVLNISGSLTLFFNSGVGITVSSVSSGSACKLNITTSLQLAKNANAQLYDVIGNKISEIDLSRGRVMDVSTIGNGLYFILIQNGSSIYSSNVVIQK